ncbi:TetR/AcrR family transcriptional regulator [Cohnella boryungensis]|uniref:TetR/AcrR family transcriptional regulator n=1 Tax=Cohnella boryungensis TaxID=768479 RepID=A0ABV8SG22_9BACL
MNRQIPKQVQAESTRAALLRRAELLFTEFGYAKTSIDEIVKQEQLTKGAFYYNFKDKRAIFEQVVDQFLDEMVGRITRTIEPMVDPWERALTALEVYLEGCIQPAYRQIVLQEAPVVLGWADWREKEKNSVIGLSTLLLQELVNSGDIRNKSIPMLAYILFGAITEAAIGIAESDDPAEARKQAKQILELLLKSF